ncbi:hypothetical protein U9M48_012965 [Paspalum notatum var. saurae]|uniref:Protein FAR1-RELATED SEQUENCE n=1 Tax=Paspalum notatum var. saurae TaxID=547442 RepID=A0AAQ3T1D4_PASNO
MEFIGAMQDRRVPQHYIMDYVSEMHGGAENVPVTAQDVKNLKAARRRDNNANDVSKLLMFFTSCKKENPQFFSDFQLDKEGKITSIFWSNASQQGDYIDFGDAITFDTTHKTNLYDKPLCMFVGANHHLQCAVFGFALLGDEIVETFEWVFNAFKTCMGTFKTCMGTEGPRVMLTGMDYCGVMVSTQRSESMNKLVKSAHVDGNTPLHEFAKQMPKLLHSRKMKEAKLTLAFKGQRETNTLYEFEFKVARAYTRAVMNRFEESMKYATAYKITCDPDGGVNDWVVPHTKRSNKIMRKLGDINVSASSGSTHILQIDKIPKEFNLQRYTNSARQDRSKGKDGETKSYRQKTMLKNIMKIINKAGMSKAGHDKYLDVMHELNGLLDRVEPDIGGYESCIDSDEEDNQCNEVVLIEDGVGILEEPVPVTNMQQKLDFTVEGISLERPDRAKPKGRTIKETETVVRKLGAKG